MSENQNTNQVELAPGISYVETESEQMTGVINYPDLKAKAGFVQVMPIDTRVTKAQASEEILPTSAHVGALIKALADDPEYAWSWHCALAMNFIDAGCDRKVAQEGAARFLSMLSGNSVDMTKHPHYIDWMKRWDVAQTEINARDFEEVSGTGQIDIDK